MKIRLASQLIKAVTHPDLSLKYLKYKLLGDLTLSNRAIIGEFVDFNEYLGAINAQHTRCQQEFIDSILEEKSVVFDVGANIGIFALEVLFLRPQSVLTCFEPVPLNFNRLKKNLARNGFNSASLECLALSSPSAPKRMEFSADIRSPFTMHFAENNDTSTIEVNVISLDAYCEEREIEKIDLLKIDVEGYERDVLQGARNLLGRRAVTNIWIEVCPANLARAGRSVRDLWNVWEALGYTGYMVGEKQEKPLRSLTLTECGNLGCEDILLRPREQNLPQ